MGFPCGSAGKESTCNVGDLGSILGWEDPLEKGKATHSSILAWRIPWTVESMGLQRVRQDWATFTFTILCRLSICNFLKRRKIKMLGWWNHRWSLLKYFCIFQIFVNKHALLFYKCGGGGGERRALFKHKSKLLNSQVYKNSLVSCTVIPVTRSPKILGIPLPSPPEANEADLPPPGNTMPSISKAPPIPVPHPPLRLLLLHPLGPFLSLLQLSSKR